MFFLCLFVRSALSLLSSRFNASSFARFPHPISWSSCRSHECLFSGVRFACDASQPPWETRPRNARARFAIPRLQATPAVRSSTCPTGDSEIQLDLYLKRAAPGRICLLRFHRVLLVVDLCHPGPGKVDSVPGFLSRVKATAPRERQRSTASQL